MNQYQFFKNLFCRKSIWCRNRRCRSGSKCLILYSKIIIYLFYFIFLVVYIYKDTEVEDVANCNEDWEERWEGGRGICCCCSILNVKVNNCSANAFCCCARADCFSERISLFAFINVVILFWNWFNCSYKIILKNKIQINIKYKLNMQWNS